MLIPPRNPGRVSTLADTIKGATRTLQEQHNEAKLNHDHNEEKDNPPVRAHGWDPNIKGGPTMDFPRNTRTEQAGPTVQTTGLNGAATAGGKTAATSAEQAPERTARLDKDVRAETGPSEFLENICGERGEWGFLFTSAPARQRPPGG